jgi:anthranilate synthase component 1
MEKLLAASVSAPRVGRKISVRLKPNMNREFYESAIRRCKEYIAAGDIFQVVYSLRFEMDLPVDPFSVYRTLRTVNPSPYMFYLNMGDAVVLGSSPEMLVKVTGRQVEYRPIAGTRRRGRDQAEDEALARELLADEKERAEHIMLVDLGRNDVGRIAEYGSVQVPPGGLMYIERYSHVMHLVSKVHGRLREGLDMFDALASCFPAGTLSGAPKVRAMEIIRELEPTRRGVYGGSVLYMDYSGNLDSCIAIRTLAIRGRRAYLQAGGGIVADSDPAAEYEEASNKAKALVRAIEQAGAV